MSVLEEATRARGEREPRAVGRERIVARDVGAGLESRLIATSSTPAREYPTGELQENPGVREGRGLGGSWEVEHKWGGSAVAHLCSSTQPLVSSSKRPVAVETSCRSGEAMRAVMRVETSISRGVVDSMRAIASSQWALFVDASMIASGSGSTATLGNAPATSAKVAYRRCANAMDQLMALSQNPAFVCEKSNRRWERNRLRHARYGVCLHPRGRWVERWGATIALLFTLGACEGTPQKNRLPDSNPGPGTAPAPQCCDAPESRA